MLEGWGVPTAGRRVLAPHRGPLACAGSGPRTGRTEKGVSIVLGVHTCYCNGGPPLESHTRRVLLAGRREAVWLGSPACVCVGGRGVPGTGALDLLVSASADLALA